MLSVAHLAGCARIAKEQQVQQDGGCKGLHTRTGWLYTWCQGEAAHITALLHSPFSLLLPTCVP